MLLLNLQANNVNIQKRGDYFSGVFLCKHALLRPKLEFDLKR